MDRFDAMQAFARVVEAGSFTKAAETLHMSKTTVTQLVQQLEARLRVKLLNRTTRKVNVTADGAVYHERVIKPTWRFRIALGAASSGCAESAGELDSGAGVALFLYTLPGYSDRYGCERSGGGYD